MSAVKHTPGPWHTPHICDDDHPCNCQTVCDEGRYASGIASVVIGNDLPIGEGGIDGPSKAEAAANAHLIAAAPDMLAALKLAAAAMGNMDATTHVRAVIAKAEGRSA